MRSTRLPVSCAAFALCAVSAAFAQAPDPRAVYTSACAACHGEDGNSPNPIWPKLASQHPSYLARQIAAFKSGDRKDDAMSPMAMIIATDEDLADLTAHFAAQAIQAGEPASIEQTLIGQQLFRGGNLANGVAACSACHGPQGLGNAPANFPRIAGQHAPYVEKALKDYRAGTRASDPNQMMRAIAARMSEQEIAAVADYIAGLH